MTDRELMQQTLEALIWTTGSDDFGDGGKAREGALKLLFPSITALRERLAQPEQKPVATVVARQYEDGTYAGNALDWACRNCEDDLPIGTKLYTSQHPKQEQEPFCYHDGRNIVGKEYADHSDVFPLYTSPNPEQQKPVKFKCTVVDDAHPNGVPLSQWGKQHEMQPCAGRNCGSTNPNLHSAECFEDYEKATGMSSVEHAVIAGAMFDFMGWLTSRKERIVLSSADNASPAVEAITEFAKMRGLSLADAKVTDWQDMMRGNDAA